MKLFQGGSTVLSIVLISYGISFLMGTIPGIDGGFSQVKVPVEFYMENRCAETPGMLSGFAVYFCNIWASPFELVLKHTIIHLCLSKSKTSLSKSVFPMIHCHLFICWKLLLSMGNTILVETKECTSRCQFSWTETFWTKKIFTLWFTLVLSS